MFKVEFLAADGSWLPIQHGSRDGRKAWIAKYRTEREAIKDARSFFHESRWPELKLRVLPA